MKETVARAAFFPLSFPGVEAFHMLNHGTDGTFLLLRYLNGTKKVATKQPLEENRYVRTFYP